MLGKDADKNEYWFFKEDPGKLFIKKYEEVKYPEIMEIDEGNDDIMDDPREPTFDWFYYDEEDEFEKLIEACNLKGIRERRLQENLRKIRDRMKLRKTRKSKEESKE
jgi:hypothetical protein